MRINKYEIAKLTLLPGIMPRTRKLFSGFDYLSFFVAQAYAALRLLPSNHPYLNPANYGRYGVRNVMSEARRHLVRDRYHADQVILYYALMIGFMITLMQCGLFIGAFAVNKASAACLAWGGPTMGGTAASPSSMDLSNPAACFVTANYKTDMAYNMLDMIYNFNGIYNSNSMTATPNPFQTALQTLFEFYNVGILMVAAIVLFYLLITLVAETAETGSPFGRRYNGAMAPLRLIWAVAILCPLTFGLNGGQLLTLYAAKWGSSMATNAWLAFTYGGTQASKAAANPLNGGGTRLPNVLGSYAETVHTGGSMVAYPQTRILGGLVEYMFVVLTCSNYEFVMHNRQVNGYIIYDDPVSHTTKNWLWLTYDGKIKGPFTLPSYHASPSNFDTATDKDHTHGHDIRIRFGEGPGVGHSEDQFDGNVSPICGEMTFPVTTATNNAVSPSPPTTCAAGAWYCPSSSFSGDSRIGARDMESDYFDLLEYLWTDQQTIAEYGGNGTALRATAVNFVKQRVPNDQRNPAPAGGVPALIPVTPPSTSDWPGFVDYYVGSDNYLATYEAYAIYYAWLDQVTNNPYGENYDNLGWAAAGIWYNKIAEMNGSFITAVHAMPMANKYPAIMETVSQQKQATDQLIDPQDRYKPYKSDGNLVDFASPDDKYEAMALYQAQQIWRQGYKTPTNSSFIDTISTIFGLEDVFSMRQNIGFGLSPLAHLVAIGRGMVEASIRNLGYSFGAGLAGGLANVLGLVPLATVGKAAARIVSQVAFLGLGVGFILFYVIPFLPFLYFFFSMSTWIKSIFQALVGIPLWGIAHLRIDGEGLPGRAGMNGYYLLLEVFLRPVLCVVGLIGGITVFAAELGILNDAWDTLIANVTGFDYSGTITLKVKGGGVGSANPYSTLHGIVDQFFYTIIYTIVAYIMALNSFKLCDKFPDHMMQWLGTDLQSFGEMDPNPAEGLLRRVAMAEQMLGDSKNSLMIGLAERNSE